MDQRARHSRCSRNPFRAGHGFRGYSGSQLLRPVRLLAPQYGPDRSPGQRGLLLPGFQRVGRPPRCWTGYDYNSVWTPLLAGLSPAGMAASLAALVRPCSRPTSKRRRKALHAKKLERNARSHVEAAMRYGGKTLAPAANAAELFLSHA